MAEKFRVVTDLDTVEVSLVGQGAQRKKFAFFKDGDQTMDETKLEFLKTLLETEAENEGKLEATLLKQEVDEKARDAVRGALRLLSALKDKISADCMKELAAMAGYPAPTATPAATPAEKQAEEDEKKKEEEKKARDDLQYPAPGETRKAGHKDETEEEKMKRERMAAIAKEAGVDADSVPVAMAPMIEALWKQNLETKEQLKKEIDLRETTKAITKARDEYGHLPASPDELGPILKSLQDTDPEQAKKIEAILKRSNVIIQKGSLLEQFGSDYGGGEGSVVSQIETRAKEMVQKGLAKTKEQAFAKVLDMEPELYEQYQNEKRSLTRH